MTRISGSGRLMSPGLTRRLLAVHRWASLIVSANFIVLAITGLILVFHEEIDIATGVAPKPQASDKAQSPAFSLAQTLRVAQNANPELHPIFATQREESPGVVLFGFAGGDEYARASKVVGVDRNNGHVLPKGDFTNSFTFFVLRLHAELLAGPPGRLVLGVVGVAILVSILTGIAVYGPTMRRFSFGRLRRDKSARTFLADRWEHVLFPGTALATKRLHFGNYGGLPLKLRWTAFTFASLALSISGVWAFCSNRFKRRQSHRSVDGPSEGQSVRA